MQIFEAAISAQKITHTDVRIFEADQQQAISKIQYDDQAIDAIKTVIKRILVSYGINPSVAFTDEAFKKMYLEEVLRMVRIYHPSLSADAFGLAIELNIIDHWAKKVELYGSNISVNFLMEVLKVYKLNKGKSVAACEKVLPDTNPEKPMPTKMEVREMLLDDARKIVNGDENAVLRLPSIYYNLLVEAGELQETDENLKIWMYHGNQTLRSLRNMADKKVHSPQNLKELDTARRMAADVNAKTYAQDFAVRWWIGNVMDTRILNEHRQKLVEAERNGK